VEIMSVPQKCQNCLKFHNKTVVNICDICNKLQFPEENLCDLLRFKETDFGCAAYKPKLQLVTDKTEFSMQPKGNSEFDDSQRNKWIRSYLVEQQKQNPDQIQFKLRYHIVLITRERSAILTENYFKSFSRIFKNTTKSFYDTTIDLMWISSDHIHLYLDSSPDFSVDEIYKEVVNQSERVIYMKHPELKPENQDLWENSYFVETFG
jgi:putative transposase